MLIGLSGKKGSGKDTCYSAISRLRPGAVRLAFADVLKEELAAACDTTVQAIEMNKSVFRLGLQWWGTEFRRKFHSETYWLDRMADKLRDLHEFPSDAPPLPCITPSRRIVVITDVRFPNEFDFIKERGGLMVRIARYGADEDMHPSETALDGHSFDFYLDNSSTMAGFHVIVGDLLDYLDGVLDLGTVR
jgi:hypothetical protein